MDKSKALQRLLNGTASEEDVELLKQLLASGEISIGGNVNHSVIIIGNGNTVDIPPSILDRLNARPMLGNLDRDLTGEEIASGLRRLDKLLPNRAPVLLPHYKEQVGRLRPTLKTEIKALSETARRERVEALAAINSICVEALDVSFNGLCLGEEAPKYEARSPFRGLESFRPEDSEFFFGREALTQKLVGKIKAHSFLAVLGASGSGKSSLVMAGVIPALNLDYIIFRPGTKPLDELESAHGNSLIVVDQFEELFTLTRDQATHKEFIARLLDESARARIILTLRSDFLGEVGAYRTLSAEIQNHLEIVSPMDMGELRRAMEGQAGVVGLRFEADLSQQILDDVEDEPGAMPLLQHALWELWNRRHGRNLRASEYRAFGGVKQAITSTAEKVYADCSKPEQDQVRDIFLRLTRLDDSDEGRDTRRRVPLGDLIPSGRDAASITLLLDKLANARLIVKTVNEDNTEVEVAHEALIRHWERLRGWLNEDRDALRLRAGVGDAARQWELSRRDENLLSHRGARLDLAVEMSNSLDYQLNPVEQAYLDACVEKRDQEKKFEMRFLEMSALTRISQGVSVTYTLDDIQELIFAQVSQLMPLSDFNLTYYSKDTNQFYYGFNVVNKKRMIDRENKPFPFAFGLSHEVIRKKHLILTQDYMEECQRRLVTPSSKGLHAWMGVPLVIVNADYGVEVIGALSVGCRDATVTYTNAQVELLQSVADQTVGGIVKARLLQETQDRARQLSTLSGILRNILASLKTRLLKRFSKE